jgi:hypothetical protein
MKHKMRIALGLGLALLLFSPRGLMAQDYSKVEGENQLQFNEQKSKVAFFTIDVTEGYNYLKILVKAQVQEGNLLCEILDPEGKLIREINIVTSANTGKHNNFSSMMKGEMQKSIRMPEKGNWMVRLSPEKKAVAFVTVEHMLAFHPKVDVLELEQIDADLE